jgi:hypothetical protein
MTYFPHGAIAAAQAAERKKQAEFEEEEMTHYTTDDLQQGWEFKIVRSGSGIFRRPQVLQALIEEEAVAGWELLEKLDDSRVRFKRRIDKRSRDYALPSGIDPYRTQYGRDSRLAATIAGLISTLVLGLGVLVFFVVGGKNDASYGWPIVATMIPLVLIVMLAVMLIVRRK